MTTECLRAQHKQQYPNSLNKTSHTYANTVSGAPSPISSQKVPKYSHPTCPQGRTHPQKMFGFINPSQAVFAGNFNAPLPVSGARTAQLLHRAPKLETKSRSHSAWKSCFAIAQHASNCDSTNTPTGSQTAPTHPAGSLSMKPIPSHHGSAVHPSNSECCQAGTSAHCQKALGNTSEVRGSRKENQSILQWSTSIFPVLIPSHFHNGWTWCLGTWVSG